MYFFSAAHIKKHIRKSHNQRMCMCVFVYNWNKSLNNTLLKDVHAEIFYSLFFIKMLVMDEGSQKEQTSIYKIHTTWDVMYTMATVAHNTALYIWKLLRG